MGTPGGRSGSMSLFALIWPLRACPGQNAVDGEPRASAVAITANAEVVDAAAVAAPPPAAVVADAEPVAMQCGAPVPIAATATATECLVSHEHGESSSVASAAEPTLWRRVRSKIAELEFTLLDDAGTSISETVHEVQDAINAFCRRRAECKQQPQAQPEQPPPPQQQQPPPLSPESSGVFVDTPEVVAAAAAADDALRASEADTSAVAAVPPVKKRRPPPPPPVLQRWSVRRASIGSQSAFMPRPLFPGDELDEADDDVVEGVDGTVVYTNPLFKAPTSAAVSSAASSARASCSSSSPSRSSCSSSSSSRASSSSSVAAASSVASSSASGANFPASPAAAPPPVVAAGGSPAAAASTVPLPLPSLRRGSSPIALYAGKRASRRRWPRPEANDEAAAALSPPAPAGGAIAEADVAAACRRRRRRVSTCSSCSSSEDDDDTSISDGNDDSCSDVGCSNHDDSDAHAGSDFSDAHQQHIAHAIDAIAQRNGLVRSASGTSFCSSESSDWEEADSTESADAMAGTSADANAAAAAAQAQPVRRSSISSFFGRFSF